MSESSDDSAVDSITRLTLDKFSSPLVTTDVIEGDVKFPLFVNVVVDDDDDGPPVEDTVVVVVNGPVVVTEADGTVAGL